MYFALFYLLFFTLDILLLLKFQALGLIPMEYFVAGVGMFCGVIFLKDSRRFEILKIHRFVMHLFMCIVFLISISSLILPIFCTLLCKDAQVGFRVVKIREIVLLVCSGILFVSALILIDKEIRLRRWFLLSSIGGILRFSIMRVDQFFPDPFPFLIWRYLGVFDLIMLFGWLMILHALIHAEDDAEPDIFSIPSLR